MHIDTRYLRLGRALFGSYYVHTNGLTYDHKPVPTWYEINAIEHEKAGAHLVPGNEVVADGVLAHWQHVAIDVATSPEHAEAIARAIESRYEENEVYQKVTG